MTGVSHRDRVRGEEVAQQQHKTDHVHGVGVGSRPGQGKATQRKRKEPEARTSEPPQQAHKKVSRRQGMAGSSGSALTNVIATGATPMNVPIPDYDRFAEEQNKFWETHLSCYLFDQRTFEVPMDQCI